MKKVLLIVLFSFLMSATPPAHVGNFANERIPTSTFGLGQLITTKSTSRLYLNPFYLKNGNQDTTLLLAQFLYGLTDYISVYGRIPTILQSKKCNKELGGMGDLYLQLEWAFFQKSTIEKLDQATILGGIFLPTGKKEIDIPGFSIGTTYFLIGATASRITPNWYFYGSLGGGIFTKRDNESLGNIFLYEWGIGHNLGNPGGITLLGAVEFNGILSGKNSCCKIKNENTGGNIIFFGPTFYSSYHQYALYGGIQFPILQQLNGCQDKQTLQLSVTFSVAF